MKRSLNILATVAILALTTACTRIETGEVGLRKGLDKQISSVELLPGSFNQTLIGSVLTFPVKDVAVNVNDLTPPAKDNSTMADFDATVIYSINPKGVSDLYTNKSSSFHTEVKGDVYLMYNYIYQLARNASYIAARKYEALEMNDNRQNIEQTIAAEMRTKLVEEKLDGIINITQVQVRSMLPAASVVASANELVKAKNAFAQKSVEVQTAMKEAERIQALNANKGAIEYMNANSIATIAEAVKLGKVNTIILPMDFKGIVNVGNK